MFFHTCIIAYNVYMDICKVNKNCMCGTLTTCRKEIKKVDLDDGKGWNMRKRHVSCERGYQRNRLSRFNWVIDFWRFL